MHSPASGRGRETQRRSKVRIRLDTAMSVSYFTLPLRSRLAAPRCQSALLSAEQRLALRIPANFNARLLPLVERGRAISPGYSECCAPGQDQLCRLPLQTSERPAPAARAPRQTFLAR